MTHLTARHAARVHPGGPPEVQAGPVDVLDAPGALTRADQGPFFPASVFVADAADGLARGHLRVGVHFSSQPVLLRLCTVLHCRNSSQPPSETQAARSHAAREHQNPQEGMVFAQQVYLELHQSDTLAKISPRGGDRVRHGGDPGGHLKVTVVQEPGRQLAFGVVSRPHKWRRRPPVGLVVLRSPSHLLGHWDRCHCFLVLEHLVFPGQRVVQLLQHGENAGPRLLHRRACLLQETGRSAVDVHWLFELVFLGLFWQLRVIRHLVHFLHDCPGLLSLLLHLGYLGCRFLQISRDFAGTLGCIVGGRWMRSSRLVFDTH
mmetsp:Transcript_15608/g.37535  ORF Transcript_15608/g.37535 Transcript_15608/m.37535 type:complete len:318 (+) Transcript_15608:610-1563(+)